jgi:DNA-binding NarL/FixJ family response regulator
MATISILAWTTLDPSEGLSSAARRAIEAHGGRIEHERAVACFDGIAPALATAAGWQQQEELTPSTAIAINVVELEDGGAGPDDRTVALTRDLAERGHPGDILALDVVRLLVADSPFGRWADDLALTIGVPPRLVHRFQWHRVSTAPPITVVLAEDAAIIRAGLVSLLRSDGRKVVGEAGDYDSVMDRVRATRPHLLITDVRMPPGQSDEGLRAAALLRAEQPGLAVLVLSQFVRASAAADLLTGQTSGVGYLLKERVTALDEFLDAARLVASGGTVIDPLITEELLARRRDSARFENLGDRERDVLALMAQGLSNAAIAAQLVLSGRTVESHVRAIMTKLDLWEDPAGNRRVQAVIRWLDQH